MTDHPTLAEIKNDVTQNDVVLYMKGTRKIPQCGFSSVAVQILEHLGVEFADRNVLSDPDLREQVKVFSDWPTIPQLYVKGEFVGGSDIMREMYESGELKSLLDEKRAS